MMQNEQDLIPKAVDEFAMIRVINDQPDLLQADWMKQMREHGTPIYSENGKTWSTKPTGEATTGMVG